MSFVVIALLPALLVGMYNIGYQNYLAAGQEGTLIQMFLYGLLVMLPKIVVSYGVGLGIEFIAAQLKKEEIHEGFLVSGLLIPMVVPVGCPLWILAIATAFAVIFAKAFTQRDVRELGSGNAGATNVMRSAGFLPGLLTFVCDALKGFVATYMGKLIFESVFRSSHILL